MKYIKEAIKIFFEKKNMIYFFKIYSVSFFLSLILFVVNNKININFNLSWIITILLFPLVVWAEVSGYEAVKRTIGGGIFEFKDTYKTAWKYLGNFFLVNFLFGIIVLGGLVLFIVPGIIFGVWYSFSTWGIVEKGYTIKESFKNSKLLIKGKFWSSFRSLFAFIIFSLVVYTGLSLLPYGFGSLVITIFGGLFLLPYYLLYRDLQSEGSI